MFRREVIGVAALGVLALVAAVSVSGRFRSAVLTPSGLAPRRLAPPPPPDDTCAQVHHALADISGARPGRNTNPLSVDEVAVYRTVIERWNSTSRSLLNVSNRTFPIVLEFSDCACLKGMDVQNIINATRSFRALTGDVLDERNIRLVDASEQALIVQQNDPGNSLQKGKSVKTDVHEAHPTGLFSLSEIAFDKQHLRALVSYSFVCGSLCGSGGTWLLEKVYGEWRRTDRMCGGWVS